MTSTAIKPTSRLERHHAKFNRRLFTLSVAVISQIALPIAFATTGTEGANTQVDENGRFIDQNQERCTGRPMSAVQFFTQDPRGKKLRLQETINKLSEVHAPMSTMIVPHIKNTTVCVSKVHEKCNWGDGRDSTRAASWQRDGFLGERHLLCLDEDLFINSDANTDLEKAAAVIREFQASALFIDFGFKKDKVMEVLGYFDHAFTEYLKGIEPQLNKQSIRDLYYTIDVAIPPVRQFRDGLFRLYFDANKSSHLDPHPIEHKWDSGDRRAFCKAFVDWCLDEIFSTTAFAAQVRNLKEWDWSDRDQVGINIWQVLPPSDYRPYSGRIPNEFLEKFFLNLHGNDDCQANPTQCGRLAIELRRFLLSLSYDSQVEPDVLNQLINQLKYYEQTTSPADLDTLAFGFLVHHALETSKPKENAAAHMMKLMQQGVFSTSPESLDKLVEKLKKHQGIGSLDLLLWAVEFGWIQPSDTQRIHEILTSLQTTSTEKGTPQFSQVSLLMAIQEPGLLDKWLQPLLSQWISTLSPLQWKHIDDFRDGPHPLDRYENRTANNALHAYTKLENFAILIKHGFVPKCRFDRIRSWLRQLKESDDEWAKQALEFYKSDSYQYKGPSNRCR